MDDMFEQKEVHSVRIEGGEYDGRVIRIGADGVLIGRSEECDLVIHDRQISRRHAQLFCEEGYCFAEDLGSRNGMLVDGKREKHRCLRDGDVIDLGVLKLIYQSEDSIREKEVSEELAKQAEELAEDDEEVEVSRPPFHPLALAGIPFVVLAGWFWAFGIGAVILGFFALLEIRIKGEHRGTIVAILILVGGLSMGLLSACSRGGGLSILITEKASDSRCRENLETIGMAMKEYVAKNGEYPRLLEDLYPEYVTNKSILQCPSVEQPEIGAGYLYRRPPDPEPEPDRALVCDFSLANHGMRGGFVLRANGDVENVARNELQMIISESEY
ncbi:MAG: FHA domain-containing protein [Candidatus Brocadiia bacterium]